MKIFELTLAQVYAAMAYYFERREDIREKDFKVRRNKNYDE